MHGKHDPNQPDEMKTTYSTSVTAHTIIEEHK
jgi:hypothetical protein